MSTSLCLKIPMPRGCIILPTNPVSGYHWLQQITKLQRKFQLLILYYKCMLFPKLYFTPINEKTYLYIGIHPKLKMNILSFFYSLPVFFVKSHDTGKYIVELSLNNYLYILHPTTYLQFIISILSI